MTTITRDSLLTLEARDPKGQCWRLGRPEWVREGRRSPQTSTAADRAEPTEHLVLACEGQHPNEQHRQDDGQDDQKGGRKAAAQLSSQGGIE